MLAGINNMLPVEYGASAHNRRGFTLVELAIVVLVIGILAAVAAPKMSNSANTARENATKQSLSVLRDAIEYYKAQNGSNPALASNSAPLAPYLNGPFPAAQVGTNQNALVGPTTQNPITSVIAGPYGWAYNQNTAELRVNDPSAIAW
jgi:general secretion pathway protein G